MVVGRTLPLAALRWAKEVPSDGALVSPLRSPCWRPLDFLLRRAALPLAFCDVGNWSLLRRGKGSEPEAAMVGSEAWYAWSGEEQRSTKYLAYGFEWSHSFAEFSDWGKGRRGWGRGGCRRGEEGGKQKGGSRCR